MASAITFYRPFAALVAVALHVAAAMGVLALKPSERPAPPPEPILVHWIEPEPVTAPVPRPIAPTPPKQIVKEPPKRVLKKAVPKPAPRVVQPAPPPLMAAPEAPPSPQAPTLQPPPPLEPMPAPAPVAAADPAPPGAVATAPSTAPSEPAPAAPAPITPPRFDAAYLHNPPPAYPARSRRLGETGRVLLRVLVTATGAAERVELRTSSGSHRLDSAALHAVQRWKFVPAKQGNTPVSAWVLVPILFTLEG